jgi:mannose-6-phosphate isomerase
VLDTTPGAVPVLRPSSGAVTPYPVPVPDFALQRVELSGAPVTVALHGPSMVLSTGGDVVVASASEELPVAVGTAVFASAEDALTLSGTGEVFIASPGH